MGKSQTMFKEHVVNSDEFMALSVESQCLYFHMSLDADNIGELAGVKRLARGYGFGEAELEELREAGYLLEVEGRWFIAHYYVNNTISSNERMQKAAARSWEARPPSLAYEGELFKSKLVQRTASEQPANVHEEFSRNGSCSDNGTGIGSCIGDVSASENENVLGGVGVFGEGEPPSRCPECGAQCCIVPENGMFHGECEQDGHFWLDKDGNKVEGVL